MAKRLPNTPACMAISLMSMTGPTTRNTSREVSENCGSPTATNASASEQIESKTANPASSKIDSSSLSAMAFSADGGTTNWRDAAANAPTTR